MWSSHGRNQVSLVDTLASNGLLRSPAVINAFRSLDRAHFMPLRVAVEQNPYQDCPQSIGFNVTISAPHMHAMMAELMYTSIFRQTNPGAVAKHKIEVLDVGSGSGYLTAVMALMIHNEGVDGDVYGIEHVPELASFAQKSIAAIVPDSISSKIKIVCGDGRDEDAFPSDFPNLFDAIHVGAAAHKRAPETLLRRLKPMGSLVIPIDDELHVITRNENDTLLIRKKFIFDPH